MEKFSLSGKPMRVLSGGKKDFKQLMKMSGKEFKKCEIYLDEEGRVYYVYNERFPEEHKNPFIDF